MKAIGRVIIEGIAGTAAMTAYTNLAAISSEEQINVPAILGTILSGDKKPDGKTTSKRKGLILGTVAHYAAGIAFAASFRVLWKAGILQPNPKNEPILGILHGLTGILIWRATIKISPESRTPAVPLKEYFGVLLTGHVIFTTVAAELDKLLKNKKLNLGFN